MTVQEALLKPADMNASLRKSCLPGTRKRLIAEIIDWASQGDTETAGKNVLWLHGMAGSGKSTIHSANGVFYPLGFPDH